MRDDWQYTTASCQYYSETGTNSKSRCAHAKRKLVAVDHGEHRALLAVQVQAQLTTEREDMARFAADVEAAESEHKRNLDQKDTIMQDVLTAMQSEEAGKLAAQEQARAAKERAARLEQDAASTAATLDDCRERCKDLEVERDEAQVRVAAPPPLLHA